MTHETKDSKLNETLGSANETDKSPLGYSTSGFADAEAKMKDNTQIFEKEQIEGTPFTAMKDETGWYLLMGRFKLNLDPLKTKEEVLEEAKDASWLRIRQVILITIEDWWRNEQQHAQQQFIKQMQERAEKEQKEN